MNRIAAEFAARERDGRKSLLPYITAGFPSIDATLAILRRLPADACACAELGVPFSDPIADGPVIQASFAGALQRGFRLDDLLSGLRAARPEIAAPLVLMVSYSIVFRRGPEAFAGAAAAAGVSGLIVPDLSLEEAERFSAVAAAAGCPLVLMAAPTTTPDRRARIAQLSQPFIYYQSATGVTGERDALPAGLEAEVRALRAESRKPVCVGFGISRPEHVAAVCRVADGAIVGSAIVRRLNAAAAAGHSNEQIAGEIAGFVDELAAPLRSPSAG